MREKYESLALANLKEIAKARGIKGTSTMKKADLVEAMLLQDEKEKNSDGASKSTENVSVQGQENADKSSENSTAKESVAGKENGRRDGGIEVPTQKIIFRVRMTYMWHQVRFVVST